MKENKLIKVNKLILEKKINEAQLELSKLGSEFYRNPEYLYLRSKIFYLNKLYYLAIDTLLIALEFEQNDKIFNLIADIYDVLGNKELSKQFLNLNLRLATANSLKDELSGIYRKNKSECRRFREPAADVFYLQTTRVSAGENGSYRASPERG